MDKDQQNIGMLIEQGRWVVRELTEIKQEVKKISAWRWKLYGSNAAITFIITSLVIYFAGMWGSK